MSKWRIAALALALLAVALSLLNASWLAPKPRGKLVLVAHRGLAQQFSREGVGNETCTATRIRKPEHLFIENTVFSMQNAVRFGADAIELDVHPTSDGRMVVFHDWTLDCRTDGTGPVRARTLSELKALDVGYGYTADGGKTYPLRGRGIGAMPTVEEVLQKLPTIGLVFNFKSKDPGDADALVAAFRRAGVKIDGKYSFYGHPRVTRRLKQLVPGAWTWFKQDLKACLADYLKFGWSGFVPGSCRNTTVAIPLNYQWAIWGWPNRFLDRMAGANTKVLIMGDYEGGSISGIERPEQLGRVPRDFRGYLWIEDFHTVGRALQR
jgi:glycerophosphoryl diester phosphodiesterase